MSLRASVHETTGFSLSILVFGRELRLTLDSMRSEPPFTQPADYPAFITRQREILRKVTELANKNRQTKLQHQKAVYNALCRLDTTSYKVGDLVGWRKRLYLRACARRVVKVILDITYRIQVVKRRHLHINSSR